MLAGQAAAAASACCCASWRGTYLISPELHEWIRSQHRQHLGAVAALSEIKLPAMVALTMGVHAADTAPTMTVSGLLDDRNAVQKAACSYCRCLHTVLQRQFPAGGSKKHASPSMQHAVCMHAAGSNVKPCASHPNIPTTARWLRLGTYLPHCHQAQCDRYH